MPAIDFPASPSVNDEYSFEGRTWLWNGTGWEVKSYPAALQLGSASAPSLYFTGDPNTGLYSPGADQVAITTGGTGRLFIASDGKVGIGTSSPQELLDLDGDGNSYLRWERDGASGAYSGLTSGGILRIGPYFSATDRELALFSDNSNNSWLTTGTAQGLIFGTNKAERLRIDSSGRLLVGTSTARANFENSTNTAGVQVEAAQTGANVNIAHIVGHTNGAIGPSFLFARHRSSSIGGTTVVAAEDRIGRISFQGSDGTEFVEAASITSAVDGTPGTNDMPGRLVFSTTADGASSPTERMRIDSSGRVGIGTSSPGARLEVIAASDEDAFNLSGYDFLKYNNTNVLHFGGYNAGWQQLVFHTNSDERLRIDSSGRVGIGATTAPGNLDARTWIDQSTVNDYGLLINASGGTKIPTLWLRDASATQPGRIVGQSSLTLATTSSATTAVTIDSSQRVLIGTASATANGGVLQVSNGITFPATQSACSDANTLDDYEEGTWTPSLQFGNATTNITYTVQKGLYTKIGNTVRIVIDIQLSSKGTATGAATIAGFPFTINNTNGTSVATGMSTITTDSKGNLLLLMASATTAQLRGQNSNSDYTDAAFGASTIIRFTGTYQVS